MKIIPLWLKELFVFAVIAGLVMVGFVAGEKTVYQKWDKEKADIAAAAFKAEQSALEKERQWNAKYQGAINERTKAESRLAAYLAAAADADGGLRVATEDYQRRLSNASGNAYRASASTVATLLSECSGKYRELAAAADGHVADVQQLEEAWPK